MLTLFYLLGMIPLALHHDISFITKFTTANSLLTKLMVCAALYVLAPKFGDILTRSTMKISPSKSKLIAICGGVVLCVLSYSLFMSLNLGVLYFLAGLAVLTFVYVAVFARNVNIANDLAGNYTDGAKI